MNRILMIRKFRKSQDHQIDVENGYTDAKLLFKRYKRRIFKAIRVANALYNNDITLPNVYRTNKNIGGNAYDNSGADWANWYMTLNRLHGFIRIPIYKDYRKTAKYVIRYGMIHPTSAYDIITCMYRYHIIPSIIVVSETGFINSDPISIECMKQFIDAFEEDEAMLYNFVDNLLTENKYRKEYINGKE